LVPHDILRVSGEEAVQQYLLHEIQQVYQSQKVEINDKHCEIIIARMLRKVKIETSGDTSLLPGLVMDRFQFRKVNEELTSCIKITNPGDSDFSVGVIIPRETFEQTNAQIEALGGTPAKGKKPKSATASTQLLGITKAAVQSNSFISAASFQETTKVLTEAALAGKVDKLVGLKENVILGHLIPAGTGFRIFQESEVNYRREALEELATAPVQSLEESFPLLNADEGNVGFAAPAAAPSDDLASSFPPAVESPVVESPAIDPSDTEVPSDSSDAIGGADSMLGGSPE
jgi:DNA-directed RNA polymerase subunit beta'